MKSKISIWISVIIIALAISGCNSIIKYDNANRELVPRAVEYPTLLPPERAHLVTVKMRAAPPTILSQEDIAIIVSLVGRVPGLYSYNIELIVESKLWPGMIEVPIFPFIVVLERGQGWRVFKVVGYSA